MNKLKKAGLILGSLLLLSAIGVYCFGTSDLRTEIAKNQADASKAKQLLMEMGEAHGIAGWDQLSTYKVTYEDEFFGFIGWYSKPFKDYNTRFELQYIPESYDGQLKQISGPNEGKHWGIQSWQTYYYNDANEAVFKTHGNTLFWLPTYQYFIEFPLRIQQATALAYAGTATINGIACEGILASWDTTAPQRDIDQYLIWLDSKTKRIVKLEYTIREMYNFLTGAAYFTEYQNYNGIMLPAKMPVESNIVLNGFLHEMRILDFEPDPVLVSALRPDNELEVKGDKK